MSTILIGKEAKVEIALGCEIFSSAFVSCNIKKTRKGKEIKFYFSKWLL